MAVTTAAINFVDLAGSERAAHSAETGEAEKLRAKEVRRLTNCRPAKQCAKLVLRKIYLCCSKAACIGSQGP